MATGIVSARKRASKSKTLRRSAGAHKPRRVPEAKTGNKQVYFLDTLLEERMRLMRAEAVLECLAVAMDYNDGGPVIGHQYSPVVEVVRDLINTAIGRLDSVNFRDLQLAD